MPPLGESGPGEDEQAGPDEEQREERKQDAIGTSERKTAALHGAAILRTSVAGDRRLVYHASVLAAQASTADRTAAFIGGERRAIALPRVDVVVPIFNEKASAPRLLEAIEAFRAERPEFRFILVDDGSTDGTVDTLGASIDTTVDAAGGVVLVRHEQNLGKGAAIHTGMSRSTADFVCFIDGDLAYPLSDLVRLRDALEHADVVIGSRSAAGPRANGSSGPSVHGADDVDGSRAAGPLRHILGEGFNRLVRMGLGLPHRDTQAGIKGFRAEAARLIRSRQRSTRFTADAEMLFIARCHGLRVTEIPVRVDPAHRSKRSSVSLLRDPARMLIEVARIRLDGWRGRYR